MKPPFVFKMYGKLCGLMSALQTKCTRDHSFCASVLIAVGHFLGVPGALTNLQPTIV